MDPAHDAVGGALAGVRARYDATSDVGLAHLIAPEPFDAALQRLEHDLRHPDPHPASPPAGSRLADRLIVIVGCGRSGTTWVHDMLTAHPRVAGVPGHESWLFAQLRPFWEASADRSLECSEPALVAALRRFCDTVLSGHAPGSFAVEKTPVHSYLVRQISAVYPDAWFVHVIRDGRDVARSIAQTPFFRIPDPGDAAALWGRVIERVRSEAPQVRRYREVRYENLLRRPVEELTNLVAWTGLGAGEEEIRPVLAAAPRRVSTHAGTAVPLGSRSWRALPRPEVRRIYARSGGRLCELGYASRTEVIRGRLLGR